MSKPTYIYLSFADKTSFRGATIVEAADVMEAVQKTWKMNINPGGEVIGGQISPDDPMFKPLLNTLVTDREEMIRLGGISSKDIGEVTELLDEAGEVPTILDENQRVIQ